jgi:hypothetical protein
MLLRNLEFHIGSITKMHLVLLGTEILQSLYSCSLCDTKLNSCHNKLLVFLGPISQPYHKSHKGIYISWWLVLGWFPCLMLVLVARSTDKAGPA